MEIPKTPGTPPAMTYEQYKQIIELKRLKELGGKHYTVLARELGLRGGTVINAARKGIKRYDYAMWRERQEQERG
jgi:DNA invertase Pin-like site-specific DNA recombinase